MKTHFSTSDKLWMKLALEVAWKGIGHVSPNPHVGAVLVKDGQELSRGAHLVRGEEHAEVNALKDISYDQTKGAVLYVTLEPCCHTGKTPPCTDLIIETGIQKVIIAMPDPNPKVSGKGIAILRAAGIEVQVGLLQKEAVERTQCFIKNITQKKSFLFLKAAVTLDGKLATASGHSKWISNELCRKQVYYYRSIMSGVLCGATTLRNDNPDLIVRSEEYMGADNPCRFFVLHNFNGIREDFKVVQRAIIDNKTIFIVPSSLKNDEKQRRFEELGVRFSYFDDNNLSFDEILSITSSYGVDSVMLEGGGKLISQAIKENAIDSGEIFIAPIILGDPNAVSICSSLVPEKIGDAFMLMNATTHRYGDQLSYRFTNKFYGDEVKCLPV